MLKKKKIEFCAKVLVTRIKSKTMRARVNMTQLMWYIICQKTDPDYYLVIPNTVQRL